MWKLVKDEDNNCLRLKRVEEGETISPDDTVFSDDEVKVMKRIGKDDKYELYKRL